MISAKSFLVVAVLPFLTVAARADKIHFLSKADKGKVVGNVPDYLEGKIISEDANTVEIRVQGGRMIINRKQIVRIEKDDTITVADIETREKAAAVRLQNADSKRLQRQGEWADAVAKRRKAQGTDAPSKELRIVVDFKGILPTRVISFYDPILHLVNTQGIADVIEDFLLREIERLRILKFTR